jgi:L-2-hydroxycarboxylate dehydrogenase (NAD+)
MLDRFKVPEKDEVRVSADELRETVTAIFQGVGVPPDDAEEGANSLVMSDLRGVETHGVSNMLRRYVEWLQDGTLNPSPNWTIMRETPAIATIDGDGGLGVIQGPKAMRLAIEKARNVGVGIVIMRNSGHLGAVGHHAMVAAQHDMVGVCLSAAGPRVLPTFGAEPRLGTNPIAYAAPARNEPFVLFDVSTTVIAENKLRLARRVGATLEPGWIARPDGSPILERTTVPDTDQYVQLPLGGTREHGSHKGYGFALMNEILATFLSAGVPTMLDPTKRSKHYFAAYDIASFSDVEFFKDTMDEMLKTLRQTPTAPGHERVLYPGLLEHEEEQQRRALGIPLHREVIEWFDKITAELSLPPLETVTGREREPDKSPTLD